MISEQWWSVVDTLNDTSADYLVALYGTAVQHFHKVSTTGVNTDMKGAPGNVYSWPIIMQ